VEAVIPGAIYIPVKPGGKAPLVANWSSESFMGCDPLQHPRLAMRCDGIVVVDCDSGEAAKDWLARTRQGTYTVKTPRGWHFYYRWTEGSPSGPAVGVLPSVDIRAGRGSYVLCPPTEGYELRTGSGGPLEAFNPSWLPEGHTGPLTGSEDYDWDEIPEGRRNVTLAAFAGTMRRQGMSLRAMFRSLGVLNKLLCDPQLDRDEVAAIAQSACRYSSRPAIEEVEIED